MAELDEFGLVEAVAERYRREHGVEPLNLSHWDPSEEFSRRLAVEFDPASIDDPLKYLYSYDLDTRGVLEALGFDPSQKGCLITPNGTTSMLCAVNWLAARQVPALRVLAPFYFPVAHQARLLDVPIVVRYMRRQNGQFFLPDEATAVLAQPIWLTTPTYCCGTAVSESDTLRLERFLQLGGTLLADECLALAGSELSRRLGSYPGFVGLYCPHKSVCLNKMKFSALVFDRSHQSFFDQWADVLYGGLPGSCMLALKHYLSPRFSSFDASFREKIAESFREVKLLARACPEGEFDSNPVGHFAMFYDPALPATLGADENFLWKLATSTAAVVIPGTRNHLDPSLGFSFRINLALDGAQFRGAVGRTFRFLAECHPRGATPARA